VRGADVGRDKNKTRRHGGGFLGREAVVGGKTACSTMQAVARRMNFVKSRGGIDPATGNPHNAAHPCFQRDMDFSGYSDRGAPSF
jgi:hypothetical protein